MMYIVSLTSYGKRLEIECPIALFSILSNNVLPDKICLVIDICDKDIVPQEFKNNQLIEIIYSDLDIKSHNKYYHTMMKYPNDVIITIDDDVIYPPTFIEDCINAYTQYPKLINACRVHKIKYKDNILLPYKQWEWESKETEPSYDLFFTGVGGVVYPPGIFKEDLDLELIKDYIQVDDILLNYLSRKHNIKVRRIPVQNEYKDINIIPFKHKLCVNNIAFNNDLHLKKIKFNQLLKQI